MVENRIIIGKNNIAIERNENKCIHCGACKSVCKFLSGIALDHGEEEKNCIHCGQCINVCPTGALKEVTEYKKIEQYLKDSHKIVIFSTAPATRVALGDAFGFPVGSNVDGLMVGALKLLGADYVFDTTFGADLTVMEEALELKERLEKKGHLPQFTSCCPAWVSYQSLFFPKLSQRLSTTYSPIAMEGAMIKTYFAERKKIDPHSLIHVAVVPCTAKKYEKTKKEFHASASYWNDQSLRDTDYVITCQELVEWLQEKKIDFPSLKPQSYDSIVGQGSSAGVLFGTSGGVTEAVLRTFYYLVRKESPSKELLNFVPIRGMVGVKEALVVVGPYKLKVVALQGMARLNKFLNKMVEENEHYDFIEVMACPGGCLGGGGQPKVAGNVNEKNARMETLYQTDAESTLKCSYENREIQAVYRTFLNPMGREKINSLLHIGNHEDKTYEKTSI